jgi:hypothetical protein
MGTGAYHRPRSWRSGDPSAIGKLSALEIGDSGLIYARNDPLLIAARRPGVRDLAGRPYFD